MPERIYIAIDLKSFYASVECVERGLDPLSTNLVVADESRTEKTICLAVSPSLKTYGISGRPRLFEVIQKIKTVNALRKSKIENHTFSGESHDKAQLDSNPELAVSYITAVPRMALYIEYSAKIYSIYLKHISQDDIHVYSIDEVFIDATAYLKLYKQSPYELALTIIRDVLKETGITATAGIGSNLYLAKVAMDIVAKKMPPDADGVRIAELDEMTYRRSLWEHRPLTDFWRVGRGYASRLKKFGQHTMGDVARCSLQREELLYKQFGVNAELLIDHAWGWEPCTIADIKAYKPASKSLGSGQVLQCPYDFPKARLVAREMADALALDLFDKGLVTDQLVLDIGYDAESIVNPDIRRHYSGEIAVNRYGKVVPKPAHGSVNLKEFTSSSKIIVTALEHLFDKIVNSRLLVRKISLYANHVVTQTMSSNIISKQFSLLPESTSSQYEKIRRESEKKQQKVILEIRHKYGKNSILKGMNFEDGATTKMRNMQIGGHRA